MDKSKIIEVDGFKIGEEKTFVIAEIGSNHNQSLQLAYESIDAAKESGADAVKFQSIDLKQLYYRPSPQTIDLHKKIDMEEGWHYLLKDYCDKKKITFFSSPTYLKSIEILEEIDVSLYKLASAQIGTFPQLVRKVAGKKKPVILSTGLVTYGELEKIIEIFRQEANDQYIILHCNSIYPTPYDRVNLQLMNTYKSMFNCQVGFSDHTSDIYVPVIAVAMGAKVIEKHFALSRKLPVPDAQYSLEPSEFSRMVDGIRAAEVSVRNNIRIEIESEERDFKERINTRLILNKVKKAGEVLKEEDFDFLRYTSGITAKEIFSFKKPFILTRDVNKGEVIDWDMIKLQ
jgi:sialic acid synthase SpsE